MNGEIYNYPELRPELEAAGHRFRTRSDTEVLVHLYEQYGEEMLTKLRGMFGFAIWDRTHRRLLLGPRPLRAEAAVLHHRRWPSHLRLRGEGAAGGRPEPGRAVAAALDQYLTLRFVQPPETFFPRIRALPPAHYMVWEDGKLRVERYWQLAYGPKWTESEAELLERIDALLAETVTAHLLSDVPVGAFLSGGLDSTLIASYAARALGSELRTFSMGIPYRDLNELPAAAAVAARYGTRHFAEEVTPSVVHDLPRLVAALDEPADPLSMCLLHLARMTAREVKVVLGGDGGDELFGGYDRYSADRWLDLYRSVPSVVRDLVSSQVLGRLPDQFTFKSFTHKLRWVDQMARKSGGERYSREHAVLLVQRGTPTGAVHARSSTGSWRARGPTPACSISSRGAPAERSGGPDDVRGRRSRGCPGQSLMILDRATMAYSLESRSPFLDVRFAEFMARVPTRLKVRGRQLRYLERKLAERYLPP